jgi:hypothetical protein
MKNLQELKDKAYVDESVKGLEEESRMGQKFIIAVTERGVGYFAEIDEIGTFGASTTQHEDIAKKHGIEDSVVLGGGQVIPSGNTEMWQVPLDHFEYKDERPMFPLFCSYSGNYGGVPNEVMELFRAQLLECRCYNWSDNEREMEFNMHNPPNLGSFLERC